MTQNETDNYEAFDLVASALEELELYEASLKAHEAEAEKDLRISVSANGEDFAARSGHEALDKARAYLEDAVKEPQGSLTADKETAKKDKKPGGDKEYFKAYYLLAMTDYLSGQPTAVDQFELILNPPQAPNTSAHRAAKKARDTADKAFVEEVRYNLGAAHFEAGNFADAIIQFDEVIKNTRGDLPLQSLARAAKALVLAKQSRSGRTVKRETRNIKTQLFKDAIFVFRIGWRNGIIIRKRKIDQKTARSIRRILAEVKRI